MTESKHLLISEVRKMVEPIAVIGLDAKFPCDGDTPEKFYEFLVDGRSARGPIPSDRYNSAAFWHPDNHREGVIGGNQAHFIKQNVKAFDAPFFSITSAEASSLDPQQRLLLECAYTAMENAGLTMDKVAGSLTGVYAGAFIWDYRDIMMKDVDAPMMYTSTGSIASTLAGRVSWFYNLLGPAITVDTACSSSMAAFHQAVVGLKAGDCDMAIACGANLILTPDFALELNALGVLSPDSISYSFDERANGYGRGEGIGAVVLKRMSDALRDGDTIRAVIRNTGSNHDGHSPGLTAPAKDSQAGLMRKTYAQAGLDPSETRFFEAHGTGTPIGDPIEASAINEMFSQYRSAEEPLFIGAVKSNVGHSEGASGITSLIKGILTLENGIIPGNAWFKTRNKKIPEEWPFHFPTKGTPWPTTKTGLRRLSINSFGVSGTNAHVVMDDALHFLREHGYSAPHRTKEVPEFPVNTLPTENKYQTTIAPQLFVLSSHDQDGISRQANTYKKALPSIRESLYNLSYTLAARRTRFSWRAAIVADSASSLEQALAEKPVATRIATDAGLGLVFTGQGAQWPRMGVELAHYPIFKESLDSADAYLKTLGCQWSVTSELSKVAGESRIGEAELSQPLCTVLQVALVDLLDSWEVCPRAVVGHSSGEIAAAYAAGAISRESAWKIAFLRGIFSKKLATSKSDIKTTMASVGLDFEQATKVIEKVHASGFKHLEKLAIACMNSKFNQTISGDAGQIEALIETLRQDNIFARKLAVEIAYHSKYMEPIAEEYTSAIGHLEFNEPSSPSRPQFFSSVYGSAVGISTLQEAAYWIKNLVSPVRFHESVTALLQSTIKIGEEGNDTHLVTDLLEVGPHAALQGPLRSIISDARGDSGVRYHHILRRGESALHSALTGAGSLFARGININLVKVNRVDGVKPELAIGLPRYPFNHSKEYWYEHRLNRNFRNRPYPRHELLGAPVSDWDSNNAIWRNWIRLSENPWVEHHTISGAVLYPAAGMLAMVIEGCRQLADRLNPGKPIKGFRFKEVSFHAALRVPDDAMGVESHLYVRPVKQAALESQASPWNDFQIFTAQDDDEWREHCRGQILTEYEQVSTVDNGQEDKLLHARSNDNIEAARKNCTTKLDGAKIYEAWKNVGLAFGPTFHTVPEPFVNHETHQAFAKVDSTLPVLKKLMPHEYVQPHLVHPTTLDGALQVGLAALISDPARKQSNAVVLMFVDELWISGSDHGEDGYLVSAATEPHGRREYEMNATAVDPATRQTKVVVRGMIVSEVDSDVGSAQVNDPKHRAWNIHWKPDPQLLSLEESEKVFGNANGLLSYLDTLAHKDPAMNFLEVGDDTRSTGSLLAALGQRYARYDFVSRSTESSDTEREQSFDERVCSKTLDIELDPISQGFEESTYDAVLATSNLSITKDINQVLGNIIGLLKPNGKIVLTLPEGPADVETWGMHLVSSGFSGVDAVLQDQARSAIVSTKPSKAVDREVTAPDASAGDYYIVADQSSDLQRSIAESLSSTLTSKGVSSIVTSIPEYAQSVAERGKTYTTILLPELEVGLLSSADDAVLAALKSIMNGKRLLWINRDGNPDTDLVTGFAASIRLERPKLAFVVLTFQPGAAVDTIVSKILEVNAAVVTAEGHFETLYKVVGDIVTVPRLVEAANVTKHINRKQSTAVEVTNAGFGSDLGRSLQLQIREIGLLDSLYFNDNPLQKDSLAAGDVEFQVKATAVNFKDLAVMLGKINETPVGLEAAGIVTRVGPEVTRFKPGDRVFGFTFKGAFSTHARAYEGTVAHIPDHVSFADAAAIPIVYTTAYACLYDVGDLGKRVSRGQKTSVLIHAAAGGVGQAAIQLAQREGAEIFATVGSLEKRDFLEKVYKLPRDHIFSSRDVTFKAGIMRMTQGRGVDIAINSLSGDILRATWECMAPFGRFAEIGLTDIESKARISMGTFARNTRYESLELNFMQKNDLGRIEDLFKRAVDVVLGQNLERLTPITTYPISQVQDALRHMQTGKHIGKLVIEPHDDDVVPVIKPPKPDISFSATSTYVVSGGFGGLGLEIIRWMAKHGAKNIIAISRKGPVHEAAQKLIQDLQQQGVTIASPACDITDKESLDRILGSLLSRLPPVQGCIQASTILNDNTFKDMTLDQWQNSLGVKTTGTRNLWESLNSNSRSAGTTLDFFIMLSSTTSIMGNTGQTNYTAGNSYQDAFARSLSAQGHNVIALNVPLMNDAGMVVSKPQLMEYLFSIGWAHMSAEELIYALDYYCRPPAKNPPLTSETAQTVVRLWLPKYSADEGAVQPAWQHEPRFNHMVLHGHNGDGNLSGHGGFGKGAAAKLISAAKTLADAEKVVLEALLEKLSKILSVDLAELDSAKTMQSYGVDSLVAVEIRTWMAKEIRSDISVFEIVGGQRIGQLAAKAAATSNFLQLE